MDKKEKKFIEKKEIKVSKILTGISNLENGESISPSTLARNIKIHPSTLVEKVDEYELAKKVGFRTIRSPQGKVRLIIKDNEDLIVRDELRSIMKKLLDIEKRLDGIEQKNKKRK